MRRQRWSARFAWRGQDLHATAPALRLHQPLASQLFHRCFDGFVIHLEIRCERLDTGHQPAESVSHDLLSQVMSHLIGGGEDLNGCHAASLTPKGGRRPASYRWIFGI